MKISMAYVERRVLEFPAEVASVNIFFDAFA